MNSRTFVHNIRQAIAFHMIMPVVFLALLIFMLSQVPIINCIFPSPMRSFQDAATIYRDSTYVECTADTLYYTGYDYMLGSKVRGHYYYSLEGGQCTIYVLSCRYILSLGEFSDTLHNVTFRAELVSNDKNIKDLLSLMAGDMNWSYDGISSHTCPVVVNEMRYSPVPVAILAIFLIFAFIFTLAHIVSLIHGMIVPLRTSVFIGTLKKNMPEQIALACEEITDAVQPANDFYITSSFIIHITPRNMSIIPYKSITQIYHYNTLHGLPMRRHMAASLTIVLDNRTKCHFRHIPPAAAVSVTDAVLKKNPDIKSGFPDSHDDGETPQNN